MNQTHIKKKIKKGKILFSVKKYKIKRKINFKKKLLKVKQKNHKSKKKLAECYTKLKKVHKVKI